MDEEEVPTFRLATCHTIECINAEIAIQIPDNGAPTMCGGCMAMIEDVVAEPEPAPEEGSADA